MKIVGMEVTEKSSKLAPVESMTVPEPEILLEHNFRVWCRGRGKDYHATLTPSSLILTPTVLTATQPPPVCCICPYSPTCVTRCCSGRTIEILGRDVVTCRPAPNGGPLIPPGAVDPKKEKKLLKKMDPAVAGLPVFMLIAYPTTGNHGSREKMILYFHLPSKKEDKANDDATFQTLEKNSDGTRRPPRHIALAAKVRDTWVHAIETSLLPEIETVLPPYQFSQVPPKLLVIVNPFSGRKKAEKILTDEMLPFFRDAGIDFEVLVTSYAGHAHEVVFGERLAEWRGIVSVSGDGLIHEILNGIFDRPDWREALARLPIGVIPGGSGNGFSRTLIYEQNEQFDGSGLGSSLLNVVRGRVKNFDLFYVESIHLKPQLAFLHLSYGILADIDIESEKCRCMGETRFTLYALQRICNLRKYRARLWYLPASDYSELENPHKASRQETVQKLRDAELEDEDLKDDETGNELENSRSSSESESAESFSKDEREVSPSLPENEKTSQTGSDTETPGDTVNAKNNINVIEDGGNKKAGDEVTVLPSEHLFNRFSYGNLLTQGHLYFRSWDELQYSVLGSLPEEPSSVLYPGNPELIQHFSRRPKESVDSDDESSQAEWEGPKFRELLPLSESLPTDGARSETVSISSQDGSTKSFLDDWVFEEGDYVGISFINFPFLDSTAKLSPKSRTDDGMLYLLIFRSEIKKTSLLKALSDVEFGRQINIPGLELIPIRAFRLEPLGNHAQGAGIMTLDGEVVPTGVVQGHVMPSAGKVFVK